MKEQQSATCTSDSWATIHRRITTILDKYRELERKNGQTRGDLTNNGKRKKINEYNSISVEYHRQVNQAMHYYNRHINNRQDNKN